jgi:hypothetical protein
MGYKKINNKTKRKFWVLKKKQQTQKGPKDKEVYIYFLKTKLKN